MWQEKESKNPDWFSTQTKNLQHRVILQRIVLYCFTDRRVRDINVTSSSVCLSICLLCNKYVWSVCMSVCPSACVVIKIEICIRLIFSRNKHILDGFLDSHQKKSKNVAGLRNKEEKHTPDYWKDCLLP
jgi:hypothetical protein